MCQQAKFRYQSDLFAVDCFGVEIFLHFVKSRGGFSVSNNLLMS